MATRTRRLSSRRLALAVLPVAAFGYSLLPLREGADIGMASTSCGSIWQIYLAPTGYAKHVPPFDDACRGAAADRLLLLAALLLPVAIIALLRLAVALLDLRRSPGDLAEPVKNADWVGAIAHFAAFVLPVVPAAVLFAMSRTTTQRRHSGQALDLQVIYAVTWVSLVVSMVTIEGGSVTRGLALVLIVESLLFFVVTAVLGISCLIGSGFYGWRPTLVRGRLVVA